MPVLLRCPATAAHDEACLLFADRCHSLRSLLPPQAALPSLPNVSANSTTPALAIFYHGDLGLSIQTVSPLGACAYIKNKI